MICPECGIENDEDAKYCEKCGTNLKTGSKITKESKSSNSKYLIIIAVIVVAVLGITVGYLFQQGSSDSQTQNNNVITTSSGFPVSEAPNLASEVLKANGSIVTLQFKGVTLDQNQCIYILSKSIVMINSGQTGNISIQQFGDASEPGGILSSAVITKAEYVDMADRTYKWMDVNGRSPNHTGIDFAGSPDLSTGMTLKAFAKALTEYKATGNLPENIAV